MKKVLVLVILVAGFLFNQKTFSQCTPGDALSCPDPEENGEICPDSLPNGVIFQVYNQVITILPPPKIILDSIAGTTINLHHIKLTDVGNLPPGLTWVSNVENNVFLVGNYYCALLEGIPTESGLFPLKIVVDVYVPGIFGSPPIYVATAVDSTSLSLTIVETAGLYDYESGSFRVTGCSPNPFRNSIDLAFYTSEPGVYSYEITDLMGNKVFSVSYQAQSGLNQIRFDGGHLAAGVFLYTIGNHQYSHSGRILKTN